MVYLRVKKIKTEQYLYLVKSIWDSKKNTSKQEIIKYLGKAIDVAKEDIPIDYRNNSKILSALAKYNPEDFEKREQVSKNSIQKLYKNLIRGDFSSSWSIYQEYTKIFNMSNFFDKILKPVMYKIGEDWKNGQISIADEHVASNVAQTLVKSIREEKSNIKLSKKILLCVPQGEEHNLGCDVLETFLIRKGIKVFNLRTHVPIESILNFIEFNKPDYVFVSITLNDNLKSGYRLIEKISNEFDIPIFVGGYAIKEKNILKFEATVISDSNLEEIFKKVKNLEGLK